MSSEIIQPMNAEMNALAKMLAELAELCGKGRIDYEDGHERWWLYSYALANMDDRRMRLLFQILREEKDPAIALSVVLNAMEKIPVGDRNAWIHRLSDSRDRDYASARERDLGVLESLTRSSVDAELNHIGQEWSEWLQTRLATLSSDSRILTHLASSGSTKRIRRTAAEHLKR